VAGQVARPTPGLSPRTRTGHGPAAERAILCWSRGIGADTAVLPTGAFTLATVNLGSSDRITVSTDTRVFVRLKDSTGAVRGGSSVAPRTVP
jgi:hypothetical protein